MELIRADSFGAPTTNDDGTTTWTGVVGHLSRREADFSSTILAMTWARSSVIDFTIGYLDNLYSLIVPKNAVGQRSEAINASAFLASFTPLSWMAMLMTPLVTALVSTLIVFSWNGCHVSLRHYGHGLFGTYLSLIQKNQHTRCDYPGYSGMVLFWVLCIFGFFIYTCFVADLTANMTISTTMSRPKNFQQVLDMDYRVYTLKGTSLENFFKRDYLPPNSPIRKTYENNVELVPPKDKNRFLRDAKRLPKLAFFGSKISFVGVSGMTLLTDFEDNEYIQNAIGLQRGSELRDLFNHHILRMKQTGMLSQILQKWLTRREPTDMSHRIFGEDPISLGYQNLFGPSLVLLVGVGCGHLIGLFERGAHRLVGGATASKRQQDGIGLGPLGANSQAT